MSKELDAAMHRWSAESLEQGPPPEIEQAVLAEFDRSIRARRRARWLVTAATVAAALAVVVWMSPPPPAEVVESGALNEFTALPYVVQPAEYERTEVVRMAVPVAELIAAGFPMQSAPEAEPGAEVEADVLLGQDQRARAVRLVAIFE